MIVAISDGVGGIKYRITAVVIVKPRDVVRVQ